MYLFKGWLYSISEPLFINFWLTCSYVNSRKTMTSRENSVDACKCMDESVIHIKSFGQFKDAMHIIILIIIYDLMTLQDMQAGSLN